MNKYFNNFKNIDDDLMNEINHRNIRMCNLISGLLTIIFLLLFISSHITEFTRIYYWGYRFVMVVSAIFFIVHYLATKLNPSLSKNFTKFFVVGIYFLFAWFNSFVLYKNEAVSFYLVLYSIPILLVVNPIYLSVTSTIVSICFYFMTHFMKTPSLSVEDIFNCTIYLPISIFITFVVQNATISHLRYAVFVANDRDVDSLTGLYTKRAFELQVKHSLNNGTQNGCVLFFDLNKFKHINDTFGHSVGDMTIIEAGHAIASSFYTPAIKSRFGGDEFVVFIPGVVNKRYLQESIDRLNKALLKIELPDSDLKVTTSIGISFLIGNNKSYDALLTEADEALYLMKKTGRVVIDVE